MGSDIRRTLGEWVHSADVQVGAALAIVSGALTVVFFQLWATSLSRPPALQGDFTFYNMLVKGIEENGGYLHNPRLGWPFDLQFLDYPLGTDNLNLLLIRVISWFSPSFPITFNVWVILTFPMVAVCAFIVMRRLGASLWSAAAAGLLYTFVQYHFRAGGFLLLIGYYALPFAILLAIRVLQGQPLVTRRAEVTGLKAWFSRRTIATLVTAVAIGSTGLYLAAFTVLLLGVAVVGRLFAPDRRRVVTGGVVASVLILATVALNTAPTTIQRLTHGKNEEVPLRYENESEVYGLTLARMVFPPPDHRFGPARRFGEHYQTTTALPFTGEDAAYVGIIGVVGLGGLSVITLLALGSGLTRWRRRRYGPLAACALAAFVFGTVAGGNTVFSYVVSPIMRGLGRISVVLTFCALAAIAFAVDAVGQRARRRSRHGKFAAPMLLGVICLVGLYDQTPNPFNRDFYEQTRQQWNIDDRFVKGIEAAVPDGSPIYTLPEQSFPESAGPGNMLDYDSAQGYLHSTKLKWSYGAMRGREGRWLDVMAGYGLKEKTRRLAVCGFEGIWFDRAGVKDPAEVSRQLLLLTGDPPIRSEDGRREFFRLRAIADRERARLTAADRARLCDATFHPIYLTPVTGVGPKEADGVNYSRWLDVRSAIDLHNDLDRERPTRLTITLVSAATAPVTVRLLGPDGRSSSVVARPAVPVELSLASTLHPGRSRYRIEVTSPLKGESTQRVLRASRFEFNEPPV